MKKLLTTLIAFLIVISIAWTQKVGIGTLTPSALLDVAGDAKINEMTVGRGGNNGIQNTALGFNCLYGNTSGIRNVAVGYVNLQNNSSGSFNVASGAFTLFNNTTGSYNIAIGDASLNNNTTGEKNTGIGRESLFGNTIGHFNSALGFEAGNSNVSGGGNTFIGSNANPAIGHLNNATAIGYRAIVGANNCLVLGSINGINGAVSNTNVGIGTTTPTALLEVAGDVKFNGINAGRGGGNKMENTSFGHINLIHNTLGNKNTSFGFGALEFNEQGFYNTANGYFALNHNTNGSYNTAIGSEALVNNTTGQFNSAIGWNALFGNTTGYGNIALGNFAGQSNVTGTHNIYIGNGANCAASNLVNATAIGVLAFVAASNSMILGSINGVNGAEANTNVGIGTTTPAAMLDVAGDIKINGLTAGFGPGNVESNTVFGSACLNSNSDGSRNVALGFHSMFNNTTGSYNVSAGAYSLHNNSTGIYNSAFGDDALNGNTTGQYNTVIGVGALYYNSTGSTNTALGAAAGLGNTTGSGNTFVGRFANSSAGNLTNATAIGNHAYVGASNALVLGGINGVNGSTENTKVGIGTSTPTVALDVAGAINATSWKTCSMNTNGYAEMGGVLQQWGIANYNSNNALTITFPKSFNNVYSVTATVDGGSANTGSGVNVPVKVLNVGNNTFQIAGTATFSGDNTTKIRWMAVGN